MMHTALFSVSYAGLWGQASLTLPDFIRHAAELGYDGVLLMGKRPHLSPLDTTPAQVRELAQCLRESGVACLGVAAYTNFTAGWDCAEVPLGEMQQLYLQRLCAMTAELGGMHVRVFTGYRTGTLSPQQEWTRCVEALRAAGDIAAGHGLRIGVQNHHDVAVDTRALQMLLEEVAHPAVAASYDCWSPFLRGEDVTAGARAMAPIMLNTICADYRCLPQYRYHPDQVNYRREHPDLVRAVPMGAGDLPYADFFHTLRTAGYTGPITYEMCSPLQGGGSMENLDRYAREFLAYMRELSDNASTITPA